VTPPPLAVAESAPTKTEPEPTISAPPVAAEPDRTAVESSLRKRLEATSGDWPKLNEQDQATVIAEGMKTAIPSAEKLAEVSEGARRGRKKGKVDKEAKARQAVEEYKASAVSRAAQAVLKLIETLAKQAEDRKREANLAFDKEILRLYIGTLGESVAVKSILVDAVNLLNLSNAAFGEAIPRGLNEADIKQAAYRWNGMDGRVKDRRARVPDGEGGTKVNPDRGQSITLKIVTNMHVPGGANKDLEWKDRGLNWEKTKNLVCDVRPATNNIHLHMAGTWQKSKAQYKTRPTD
jgi:hypothetical protein